MSSLFDPSKKLIVALDGMDRASSLELVSQISNLKWVKVGLELFIRCGPDILVQLKELGLKIFLDLKFHDIPATMAGAASQAAKYGVDLITVHACAGKLGLSEAKSAASKAANEAGLPDPVLLAVTVLTSWDSELLAKELFIEQDLTERVEKMAGIAKESGIDGCVCSPLEVENLRKLYPEPFELITPGVRPEGFNANDQVRILTPASAIQSGASRLVVGRPISQAKDPDEVFNLICDQMMGN